MGVAVRALEAVPVRSSAPRQMTLLELVAAVGEVTSDEREVVATALHLLRSGRVKLCGNFRDEPIDSW